MSRFWKRAACAAMAVGALTLSRVSAAQTCSGGSSIAIAKTADLNFGSLVATGAAGTAVIDPTTGNRTLTGGVFAGSSTGYNPAGFSIALCGPGGSTYYILIPLGAITLNGSSGGTMTVDTFQSHPPALTPVNGTITTTFTVGATLHVGANQTQGTYTGVFSVWVVRP